MQAKILVVEDDPVIIKLVSGLLRKKEYLVGEAVNGKEGISIAQTFKPDLIVMDVMMPVMDGYEACRQIRQDAEIGQVPIMLLTALTDIEQKIKGFEAGADDYMAKPFNGEEFLARVSALLRISKRATAAEGQVDRQGKVIAVHSLRGGAGVSTVAVNTAAGLAQLWGQEVVLVDLNLAAGQAALYMNVPLKNTWENIADVPIEEVDADFLNKILVRHEKGVKVLAAPRRPETQGKIDAAMVTYILDILVKQYHYIVLDLPHDFQETTLAGLDASDEVLLLTTPEIAGVRAALIALQTFSGLEYPLSKVKLITNWVFSDFGIPQDKVENAIRQKIDLVIPYAGEQMLTALNFGIPVVINEASTPMKALFEDLAFAVSKEEHNKTIMEHPTEAWLRVTERIKKRRKKLRKT